MGERLGGGLLRDLVKDLVRDLVGGLLRLQLQSTNEGLVYILSTARG